MSDNSQENGSISMNEAISLLTTPVEDTVTEERPEELEASQPVEAEAEVTEEEILEEESFEETEDEADEAEEYVEEDESEEEQQDPLYTVKVDGEEYEVTLEELQSGYSRQQYFTKRSMELAEQRKAFEAEAAETKQLRDSYKQQLDVLAQQIQQTTPQEPDWVTLSTEVSAQEFNRIKANWDVQQAGLARVEQERQRVAQEQAAEQEKFMQEHIRNQRQELLNRIPQWQNDEVREKERLEVIKYAQQRGYTEEELANASDARAIEILHKAWLYDNLSGKKLDAKKKARKAPRMAKAGQPKTKAQVATKARKQSLNRLNSERSVDAAVDYLMGR